MSDRLRNKQHVSVIRSSGVIISVHVYRTSLWVSATVHRITARKRIFTALYHLGDCNPISNATFHIVWPNFRCPWAWRRQFETLIGRLRGAVWDYRRWMKNQTYLCRMAEASTECLCWEVSHEERDESISRVPFLLAQIHWQYRHQTTRCL